MKYIIIKYDETNPTYNNRMLTNLATAYSNVDLTKEEFTNLLGFLYYLESTNITIPFLNKLQDLQ